MIAELFLTCAMSLPSTFIRFGPGVQLNVREVGDPARAYPSEDDVIQVPASTLYAMTPQWDFGKSEVEVVRMLRDYENGDTGSRPHKLVIIYGQHPHWVSQLNAAGIKTLGIWKFKTHWPNYARAHPHSIPLLIFVSQVYIFDGIESEYPPTDFIVSEASRLVSYWGFFLFRPTLCAEMAGSLYRHNWRRFRLNFHNFQIWWRNEGLRRGDVRSSA